MTKQYSIGKLTGVIWSGARHETDGYCLEVVSNWGNKNAISEDLYWLPTIEDCKRKVIELKLDQFKEL